MIYISHRGNLSGKDPKNENSKNYILNAINHGFDVEVDVWMIKNNLYLGHDNPQYLTTIDFLLNEKIWTHCKNIEALSFLLNKKSKCFWHQNDNFTLTANNKIWTYPGNPLSNQSVCVMPELSNYEISDLEKCYAICTDFPVKYNNLLKKFL